MTQITRPATTIIALLTAAAVALALFATLSASPAGAVVPPKNCGYIKVKSKRYNVKAKSIRCATAKDYTTRYLRTRWKPSNYKCYRYSGSSLVFRCVNTKASPDREFYAIRR